ncbi:hypothetical protein MAPG_10054 [Magnaporthiopsis poae ATCC 64411]|uniref:Uncharacterized protein n=1 Tax=Magnaporthiopsis poae (strain ATCC 64411 / 73-15) TaxID=644358 RepID=A0A0C4EBK2_MAGP6|nr:hypothetical protein MAPG_10054 [Magnaporthiopsis poae ATCC 64411]
MAICSEAREAAIRFNFRPWPVIFLYVPPRVRSLKEDSEIDEQIFLNAYYNAITGRPTLGIQGGAFDSARHLADVVGRYLGSDISSIDFEWRADSDDDDEPAPIPRVVDPQLRTAGPRSGSLVASVAKKGSRKEIRVSKVPCSVHYLEVVWMDHLTKHMLQITELLDNSQVFSHVRDVSINVLWDFGDDDDAELGCAVFQMELQGDRLVGWLDELKDDGERLL